MKLSIIIPIYNEGHLLEELFKRLFATALPSFVKEWEVVAVDDCSTDHSLTVLKSIAQTHERISIVQQGVNKGKGAAVRAGILASKGDVVLIQDADLELSPSDIPRMLQTMHELDVSLVNGSRYLAGVDRPLSSYKRYLANRVFTFLTSVLIDVKLTDMACGYKLVKRSLWQQLDLKENRFGFEAELILKALRTNKSDIAEVPVRYFPRNRGAGKKLRSTDAFKILWTIVKYGLFRSK